MRVLICGGTDFEDYDLMQEVCFQYLYPGDTLIHGDAPGADTMAAKCAATQYGGIWNIDILPFPADWKKYGRAAGPIRNKQMLDEGKPDFVVALPGNKGTADMVKQAKKAGLKVFFPRRDTTYKGEGVRMKTLAWIPEKVKIPILMNDLVRLKDQDQIGSSFTGQVTALCADLALVFWDEPDIDQWVPLEKLERIEKN